MKSDLPNIFYTQKPILSEGNVENRLNAHHFSLMLKKIKNRQQIPLTSKSVSIGRIHTDSNELLEMEEEEKKLNLMNVKSLVKIYESNALNILDKIKEESKNPNVKFPVDKRYGFAQFENTNYVEKDCMKGFFNKYQKFKILNRKQPISKITPSFAFIKSSNEQKIIPNPLGLLRRNGNGRILRMNYQKVGDNYAKCLGNSLRYSNHISSIELANNRLSANGTSFILKSINENQELLPQIKDIDLSENKIFDDDINELINYINDSKCNLENLNLYGNLLGDENIKLISDALGKYTSYKLINCNLGLNNITDESIPNILEMLTSCNALLTFNLSHNKISNNLAAQIIKKLKSHRELKVLDLSWNNIGNNFSKPIIYEELVNQNLNDPNRVFNNHIINESLKSCKFNFRRNPLLLL